jgi:hypothetical protein
LRCAIRLRKEQCRFPIGKTRCALRSRRAMRETFSFLNAMACGWNLESSFSVENQMCMDGLDVVFAISRTLNFSIVAKREWGERCANCAGLCFCQTWNSSRIGWTRVLNVCMTSWSHSPFLRRGFGSKTQIDNPNYPASELFQQRAKDETDFACQGCRSSKTRFRRIGVGAGGHRLLYAPAFAGAVPDSPARRFQAIRSIGWHTRLSETEKDKDRDTIRDIPGFLAAGGYEVIRP